MDNEQFKKKSFAGSSKGPSYQGFGKPLPAANPLPTAKPPPTAKSKLAQNAVSIAVSRIENLRKEMEQLDQSKTEELPNITNFWETRRNFDLTEHELKNMPSTSITPLTTKNVVKDSSKPMPSSSSILKPPLVQKSSSSNSPAMTTTVVNDSSKPTPSSSSTLEPPLVQKSLAMSEASATIVASSSNSPTIETHVVNDSSKKTDQVSDTNGASCSTGQSTSASKAASKVASKVPSKVPPKSKGGRRRYGATYQFTRKEDIEKIPDKIDKVLVMVTEVCATFF